jgi:hypothetical protein
MPKLYTPTFLCLWTDSIIDAWCKLKISENLKNEFSIILIGFIKQKEYFQEYKKPELQENV